nr:KEOPS complex subunit Pcc1 [Methanohalophilus sp.]
MSTTFELLDDNSRKVERLASALCPDNLPNMSTEITEEKMKIHIESEKITSLIAVMDDLLINAKIADEMLEIKNHRENEI